MKLPRAHHMSPEELAGQVLIPMIDARFRNRNSPAARKIFQMLNRYHVGGFIFFYGHPADIRYWTTALDRESKFPLLFGADLERGLRSVFSQGTMFPHALAFGAAGDEVLLQNCSEVMAREIRSVGINVSFGPSLDLANDPDNPIVNIRAFHSDPQVVSKLANRVIQTIQRFGIAAVGKHFPGHGATKADSHSGLTELYKTLPELMSEELKPYPKAIAAGVKGLMVSHLKTPGFDKPATFEPELVREVIRKQWDYQGVVFTDALDMGAVQKYFRPWEQAFGPLEAGADVLLMPTQLPLVHGLLVDRIKTDNVFRYQTEQAVERIFRLKKWIHKNKPAQDHPLRVNKIVEMPHHIGLAAEAAERSMTLVQKSEKFPLNLPGIKKAVHIIFNDAPVSGQPLQNFCDALKIFFEQTIILNNPTLDDLKSQKIAGDSVVILSLYFRTFGGHLQKLDWKLVKSVLAFLKELDVPAALFIFGNPYHLNRLPVDNGADAIFLTYSYVKPSQEAAFKALCSFIDIAGSVAVPLKKAYAKPIHIPALKHKLIKLSEKELGNAKPELRNAERKWEPLAGLVKNAIKDKIFPGCVLLVANQGSVVYNQGFGRFDYDENAPEVKPDTVYDLASLTKTLATTPAVMRLIDQKKIQLTDTIDYFYPQLYQTDKGPITLADLLSHQSGLPGWKPFYETAATRDLVIEQILSAPLEYPTGKKAVYCDLGFILLADIIEKISGVSFDTFCRDQLFGPLGVPGLQFNPPEKMRAKIPPTGSDGFRTEIIQGQVNDANCFVMGGVSGHAGLFGNAEDAAVIGQMFIQKGIYGNRRHFRGATVEQFTRKLNPKISSRALGWDTPSKPSSSGKYFSENTIGHLGFTGVSMWVDLEEKIMVVLLCNRVHPDPDDVRIKETRPKLHDEIMRVLLKGKDI